MDYNKLIEHRNNSNGFARLMGIVTEEIREGYARARLTVKPEFMNPIGSVHGGCIFTLADVVGGSAAASHGNLITTISADINYLKAAINVKELTAVASELKYVKNILVYEVNIFDESNNLLAKATLSYFNMNKTIEL